MHSKDRPPGRQPKRPEKQKIRLYVPPEDVPPDTSGGEKPPPDTSGQTTAPPGGLRTQVSTPAKASRSADATAPKTDVTRRKASRRKLNLPPALEEAVARCVTRGLENRGKGLLALVRRVAGMNPRPPESLLRRAVVEWDSRCVPPADGRWLRGLWPQFRLALARVKFPTGTAFARFLQAAREADPPACTEPFRHDAAKVLLVKLCRALGANAGGGPFPMSYRQAGLALGGYSKWQGERLLRELAAAGIIELVTAGRQGPGLQPGTTWRYLGGDNG